MPLVRGDVGIVARASSDFAQSILGTIVRVIEAGEGRDGQPMLALYAWPWRQARWIDAGDVDAFVGPMPFQGPPPKRAPEQRRQTCVDAFLAHCRATGNGDLVSPRRKGYRVAK